VRWRNIISGTRQDEFCRHSFSQGLLQAIVDTHMGCNIAGVMVNVLVYANGIVLLVSSWVALQFLVIRVNTRL